MVLFTHVVLLDPIAVTDFAVSSVIASNQKQINKHDDPFTPSHSTFTQLDCSYNAHQSLKHPLSIIVAIFENYFKN
ncbi:hypothetical protein DESC_70023 [Desulfosarcina cetonica]|nr:hypothetical protein DESC_70023 [Desulfosarcina cetonica]